MDKATQDAVRQELSGQSIIVFSTLNSDQNSIKALSDFAQQTDLTSYTVLSTDSSSSVALEARYPNHPSIMEIRTKANLAQIDVNIVAGQTRRKKRLLLADMDATIIRGESLDELANLAGIADKIIPITKPNNTLKKESHMCPIGTGILNKLNSPVTTLKILLLKFGSTTPLSL